ncbi:MAG: ATP-dependent DNA ligase [Candidatus Binatia bacterium]
MPSGTNALTAVSSYTPSIFWCAAVENVLRLPIEERRELLSEALRKVQYPVIQSVPFDVKPAELLRAAEALQFEGVIAKRKHSIYEPGQRSGA